MHKSPRYFFLAYFLAACALFALPAAAKNKPTPAGMTKCTMKFSLKGWSAFYQTAKGNGKITCDNGQKATVGLKSKGGGITFSKTNIANGSGVFTPVKDLQQLYGKYAQVGGTGAAVKGRIGYSLSKDDITLEIKGTGTGGGFGFDFSGFRISPSSDPYNINNDKDPGEDI